MTGWRGHRRGCVRAAGTALLALLLFATAQEDDFDGVQEVRGDEGGSTDAPIPDKVGAEVHLSKKERGALKKLECSMCKAILSEMHMEVSKHAMTTKGVGAESQVIETSNAMCLAILQRYKLNLKKPSLEPKAEDEDDQMSMGMSGENPQDYMRAMLVLKMGCQRWLEDYGGDTSGFIFKSVRDNDTTPDGAAQEYCVRKSNPPLCGKRKEEKKKAEKAKEKERSEKRKELRKKEDDIEEKRKKDDPLSSLPEDSKLGLQRMLEMAKDDPLHYMEDDARARVLKAQADLRCDVCRAIFEESQMEILKKPKSMRGEDEILTVIDGSCEGGKDLSVPNYFGIEPPPLPPRWTDRYRPKLDKKTNRYALKRFPKKAAKERKKWREAASTGKQKPPGGDEGEGDSMMVLACKDVLEPARMAEVLFEQMAKCKSADGEACSAAVPVKSAALVCRASKTADTPCAFAEESASGDKTEL